MTIEMMRIVCDFCGTTMNVIPAFNPMREVGPDDHQCATCRAKAEARASQDPRVGDPKCGRCPFEHVASGLVGHPLPDVCVTCRTPGREEAHLNIRRTMLHDMANQDPGLRDNMKYNQAWGKRLGGGPCVDCGPGGYDGVVASPRGGVCFMHKKADLIACGMSESKAQSKINAMVARIESQGGPK